MSRSRGWCFTLNNYTNSDIAYVTDIEALKYKYLVAGFEIGDSGTPHIQGYVYFENAKTFTAVQNLFPNTHLEPMKGSIKQAIDYCKEDGDYYEVGTEPKPGCIKKEDLDYIMANPYENFHLFQQYQKTYKMLKSQEINDHTRRLYYCIGKDIFEVASNFKVEEISMYPSEYRGERVILCEDEYYLPWVERWIRGYPQTERVGYEYIRVDPEIVIYIVDAKGANYLIKKYSTYIERYGENQQEQEIV